MSNNFVVKANSDIQAEKVRLVFGSDSKIVLLAEAQRIADIGNTDLVQINDAEVPVCKLLDFSRYVYDLKQAAKENSKKQKQTAIQLKEIQFNTDTHMHDLEIKAQAAKKFLSQGKLVLINVRLVFRNGVPNSQVAEAKINSFLGLVGEYNIHQQLNASGRSMTITIKG